MDVALHRLPVTVVLDRAGHHRRRRPEPQRHVGPRAARRRARAAHRRAARRADAAGRAATRPSRCGDGPTVVRFPKTPLRRRSARASRRSAASTCSPSRRRRAGRRAGRRRRRDGRRRARRRAARSRQAGYTVRVVDPRWVTPVDPALVELARQAALVVTVEDGVVVGGVGSRVAQALRDARHRRARPARSASRREFLAPRQGRRRAGLGRADRPRHRPAHRGVVGRRCIRQRRRRTRRHRHVSAASTTPTSTRDDD